MNFPYISMTVCLYKGLILLLYYPLRDTTKDKPYDSG